MKKKLLLITFVLTFLAFWMSPKSVSAGVVMKDCPSGGQGFDTAIGCIPFVSGTDPNTGSMATFFLRWGLGVGGGVAFVLMIFASFQIMTSSGDPHKLQAGKELLTSAIAGLLLLIFSVYILRIVGVEILDLTQFGF